MSSTSWTVDVTRLTLHARERNISARWQSKMSRHTPKTYAYAKAREALKALRLPCHICLGDIDYALPASHPMSFQADHKYAPDIRPDLAHTLDGLLPSHRQCNRRRGRPRAEIIVRHLKQW